MPLLRKIRSSYLRTVADDFTDMIVRTGCCTDRLVSHQIFSVKSDGQYLANGNGGGSTVFWFSPGIDEDDFFFRPDSVTFQVILPYPLLNVFDLITACVNITSRQGRNFVPKVWYHFPSKLWELE